MVNLGKLAKQAKGLVDKHGDKVAQAVDKATDAVDKKTKGKYKDQLAKVDDAAQRLDKKPKPGEAEAGGREADPTPPS